MNALRAKFRYRIPLGVALGLMASALSVAVLPGRGGGPGRHDGGRLLSECDGSLREVVVHYVPDAADVVVPVYRDFFRQLPAGVIVRVVCRDRAAFDDLASRLPPIQCVLSPVIVDHPITGWSRDRWLALRPAGGGDTVALLRPRAENGAAIWPDRAGDQQVAADLAAALGPGVAVLPSDLYFDGGDVAADELTAFVTPAMPRRNVQRTVQDREELRERLAAVLDRRVVLLHDAPDHHTAMYMVPVGNRTVLVGDPELARRLLVEAGKDGEAAGWFPGGPDFSPATQARFDAVAGQCRAAGYRVVRIPVVPGCDGRTYLTYVNAIMEERDGRRVVYMPVFAAADALNRAAARVWADLGYEVHRVRCDSCYRYFGTLHCLVNVLRRG